MQAVSFQGKSGKSYCNEPKWMDVRILGEVGELKIILIILLCIYQQARYDQKILGISVPGSDSTPIILTLTLFCSNLFYLKVLALRLLLFNPVAITSISNCKKKLCETVVSKVQWCMSWLFIYHGRVDKTHSHGLQSISFWIELSWNSNL